MIMGGFQQWIQFFVMQSKVSYRYTFVKNMLLINNIVIVSRFYTVESGVWQSFFVHLSPLSIK